VRFFVIKGMTAVRYRKIWIKFLVIIFLVVVGMATVWYAYTAYEAKSPQPEERIEENALPGEEETI
jgi:flagellar basal body-associated protein FliL